MSTEVPRGFARCLIAAAVIALSVPTVSPALAARLTPTSRMVRIEGFWVAPVQQAEATADAVETEGEAVAAANAVEMDADSVETDSEPVDVYDTPIGKLQLATRSDGTGIRPFAVTAVRAYQGFDGGMEVFHKACVRPAVNMRGRAEVIEQMLAQADGTPLTFYAQFAIGSSELLVTSIELPDSGEQSE